MLEGLHYRRRSHHLQRRLVIIIAQEGWHMLVIADNLNTRNKDYAAALKKKDMKAIAALAKELAAKKPDMMNVQCSNDGIGDEDILPAVAMTVEEATGLPLCLDSRNVAALKAALKVCKEPPIVNYLSADEKQPDEFFALVKDGDAALIIRALKGTVPTTLDEKLSVLEDLAEKANAAGVENDQLFADPSVVHIGGGMGQEHLMNAHEAVIVMNEMVDPPINTVVWISNVTAGLPKNVKSPVAASYLSYLAGAGLSAAFVNVKDPEIMKAVYLIKAFRDETVFTPAELG
jgi:cobalamin-dependent methionine synthase I